MSFLYQYHCASEKFGALRPARWWACWEVLTLWGVFSGHGFPTISDGLVLFSPLSGYGDFVFLVFRTGDFFEVR
jgi:hypothetical protein